MVRSSNSLTLRNMWKTWIARQNPYIIAEADGRSATYCRFTTAISHPGARRRVKSLWERDFCVKCDEAHFGARVLGPLGTRVPDSRASPDHFWDGGKRRTLGFPQEDQSI